ncbi:MAG: hypothetical protein V4671_16320, partial [Armatimonadota bacterium]
DDPENDELYRKVFWGNNLPSLTPEGKSYVPMWSTREVIRLKAVMKDGLQFFQAHLIYVAPD